MKFGTFGTNITRLSRRITKGILLALWICILIVLAGLASSSQASRFITGLFEPSYRYSGIYFRSHYENRSPTEHLRDYLGNSMYPPPIDAVLTVMITNPSWSERDIASKYQGPQSGASKEVKEAKRKWVDEQHNKLFSKVENKLRAISRDRSIDPNNVTIDMKIIPGVFKGSGAEPTNSEAIWLPPEAVAWTQEERSRRDVEEQRYALIDTFLLLIVLGAFGSLIFLTRDYIEREEKTTLEAYLFRPILGMFLAMAMFLVDILAHSMVSTAGILKIRHETLYLLAFAAGLLSEQAYEVVSLRAQAALQRFRARVPTEEE